MEKYKYGPLIYNSTTDVDESGNFYWNGMPPVGYDSMGIPIDPNGNQCLSFDCPLHPNHTPKYTEYNDFLGTDLPTVEAFSEWFEDNFIKVNERDYYFYILRWYNFQSDGSTNLITKAKDNSIDEMIDLVWPDAPKS